MGGWSSELRCVTGRTGRMYESSKQISAIFKLLKFKEHFDNYKNVHLL